MFNNEDDNFFAPLYEQEKEYYNELEDDEYLDYCDKLGDEMRLKEEWE